MGDLLAFKRLVSTDRARRKAAREIVVALEAVPVREQRAWFTALAFEAGMSSYERNALYHLVRMERLRNPEMRARYDEQREREGLFPLGTGAPDAPDAPKLMDDASREG